MAITENKDTYNEDIMFMRLALNEAEKAYEKGEVPVGALITNGIGEIIALSHNIRESGKNALLHAECESIGIACKKLGDWRLTDCVLYVTLEPCPMCAGAIINSRIKRVVFGAYDANAGCFGSVADFRFYPFNHKPEIEGGILEKECSELLTKFFAEKRL